MRLRTALLAITLGVANGPAHALVFSFTTIPGDSLSPAQSDAFTAAGQAWSSILSDPIAVRASVGFASLGGNVLGQTISLTGAAPYAGVRAALVADAKSPDDVRATAALPASVPGDAILLTNAQLKALGGNPGQAADGSIEFNSNFNFATSRAGDGSIPANAYDLIGIAEHEIGHLLGFDSALDFAVSTKSVLDLFRYAAAGQPGFTIGQAAYFSLDSGATSIAPFATGTGNQASHWASGYQVGGVPALLDPEGSIGVPINITPLDLQALDVIGYDTTRATVPEPMTVMLLATGLLVTAGLRRRG